MPNNSRIFFNIVAALTLSVLLVSQGFAGTEPAWLAVGDVRGHIEPCGCDPSTDMGGVDRIGTFLKRERRQNADLMLFDLGNNLSPPLSKSDIPDPKKPMPIKDRIIAQALERFRPTARLYNALEQMYGLADRGAVGKRWVLSNVKGGAKDAGPRLYIEEKGVVVFGFVASSVYDLVDGKFRGSFAEQRNKLQPFNKNMLRQWKLALDQKKIGDSFRVLLYAGPDDALQPIIATGWFHRVIRSNRNVFATEAGKQENQNPELLRTKIASKVVRMVPLGGQGVLRGGALLASGAPSVLSVLSGISSGTQSGRTLETAPGFDSTDRLKTTEVTWLEPSYGGSDDRGGLKDLFAEFDKETVRSFRQRAVRRAKGLKNSPYVGAEACATCHPKAVETWQLSSHSRAIQTLINKGRHEREECVACHVVGADEVGGYVDQKRSPHLANVQCEVCHGPRKEHVKNPLISTSRKDLQKADLEFCVTCHHSPHSPEFRPLDYWNKIKHGRD